MHILVWGFLFLGGISVFGLFFPMYLVLLHATVNISLLALLFYGSAYLFQRFYLRGRLWWFGLALSGFIILISAPRAAVNYQLLKQLPQALDSQGGFAQLVRVSVLVQATSALIAVLGIAYALLLNREQREQQNQELRAAQQAAQLDFLKAQINPHFLFNALHNIYSLVELKSPEAPKMLLKLSDLLRYVIYDGQQKTVDLKKEIQHIKNFIALYQMRSEAPLDIRFELNGAVNGVGIEPMILIPLVENCFKHTDFEINPSAFANMKLLYENGQLAFFTQNTFQENDTQKDKLGGVGLSNIQQRLDLRYPGQYQFSFQALDGIFETHLQIQFEQALSK
jgi:two-component system, LytTR family, sensor kinase